MFKIILLLLLIGVALYFFIAKPGIWETKTVAVNSPTGFGVRKEEQKRRVPFTKFGFIPLVLAAILFSCWSFTQVHAKEIGVGVSFGKPVAQYDAGLHFKPIWQSVTKIDGTIFTDSYGTGTKGSSKALPVRLGDGNPAAAKATIRWHVNPDAVDYIYATYRSDNPVESLRDAVVETQFAAVVNNAFGAFNPTEDGTAATNFNPNYITMASDITTKMDEAVKDSAGLPMIVIDKITVSGVGYSKATEARIAGIVQQASKTKQAEQLEATNAALAQANEKLKTSLAGEEGTKALVQQCFNDLADGKFTAPAGFQCWPSNGSSVVIPASK